MCCGKKIRECDYNRTDAGFLCTLCGAAYHMGMEDAIRTRMNDVGASLNKKVEMMEKRIGICEASGMEIKRTILSLGCRVTDLEKKVN